MPGRPVRMEGYRVAVVQNPALSLEDDAAEAFAPDKGESVNTLIAGFPADGPQPPILPPRDGFLFLDRDKFHASFAGDLPARPGRVHGRLPGPLGGERTRRDDQRGLVADEAQLVPGHF